jgi:hypothetical protein
VSSSVLAQERLQVPSVNDFTELTLQASVFTRDLTFQNGKALRYFLTRWGEKFTKVVFANDLMGLPDEIPRVILESEDKRLRAQAAPGRVDVIWQGIEGDRVDVKEHLSFCCDVFSQYVAEFLATVGRLGCVFSRFAPDSDAGQTVARHFCKDQWLEAGAAMGGISDFAVEVGKNYPLADNFRVSNWFKCRSAKLARPPQSGPIAGILLEQDINSHDDASALPYMTERIPEFFSHLPAEFDQTFRFYFPSESGQ